MRGFRCAKARVKRRSSASMCCKRRRKWAMRRGWRKTRQSARTAISSWAMWTRRKCLLRRITTRPQPSVAFQKRLQRYCFYFVPPNILAFIFIFPFVFLLFGSFFLSIGGFCRLFLTKSVFFDEQPFRVYFCILFQKRFF